MNVRIFIVSCAKHAEWLAFSLASISRFARGFSGTTVLVPSREVDQFVPMCHEHKVQLVTGEEPPPPLGHLWQCLQKCCADQHCDADFIFHTDSDCIFNQPVTPEDYFVNGKPVLCYQSYESLYREFAGFPWQGVVEKALHRPSPYEFMRRHGMTNPKAVYAATRQAIETAQKMPVDQYVLSCKPNYPQGFCEFNTIGQVAWDQFRDDYHWINVEKQPWPPSKIVQFWSHQSPKVPVEVWLDRKKVTVTPTEYVKQVIG